jgi:hypothetical protein
VSLALVRAVANLEKGILLRSCTATTPVVHVIHFIFAFPFVFRLFSFLCHPNPDPRREPFPIIARYVFHIGLLLYPCRIPNFGHSVSFV